MDSTGGKCMVLARNETLIARSHYYRYEVFSEWRDWRELKELGFKVLDKGKEVIGKKEAEDILNVKII